MYTVYDKVTGLIYRYSVPASALTATLREAREEGITEPSFRKEQ